MLLFVRARKKPSKKHSLCTLKGAHHPKIRNAVPIVFPRHVDNLDDTTERKKSKNEHKQARKRGRNEKQEHESQHARKNANREPIPS